jgi:two-component system, NtrC family, sensor kinase
MTQEETPTNASPVADRPRVLVAEDNAPSRILLQALLQRAQYDVSVAAEGQEAWQLLTDALAGLPAGYGEGMLPQGAFDLLLCDSTMPYVDGRELVRRVRAHPQLRLMYVIMVTADSRIESLVSGLEQGADDYVTKPFQPPELLARIKSGLRIRRLQSGIAKLEHQLAAVHLATAASHEINNPLMVLLGNWELLKRRLEQLGDAEINRRMAAIGTAAERIQKVTQELRTLKEARLTPYVRNRMMVDLSGSQTPASPSPPGSSDAATGNAQP